MSAKQSGIVWELDLPHNQMVVLLALADHADHNGNNIFPRVEFVAWKTGYKKRNTQNILRELRDAGILVKTGQTYGGVSIYKMVTDHVPRKAPCPMEPEPAGRPQGAKDKGGRGQRNEAFGLDGYGFDVDSDLCDHGLEIIQCKICTPLSCTHNRHSTNTNKSTSTTMNGTVLNSMSTNRLNGEISENPRPGTPPQAIDDAELFGDD